MTSSPEDQAPSSRTSAGEKESQDTGATVAKSNARSSVGRVTVVALVGLLGLGLGAGYAAAVGLTSPLMWTELALLALVLLGMPIGSWKLGDSADDQRRGLGLPRGSVRGMLAFLIVGSTINFLTFGSTVLTGEIFRQVLATLSTLSAAVIGFYFGGRAAAKDPNEPQP